MSTPRTLRNIGGPLVGTPPTVLAGLPGPTVAELAVASAGALNSLARTVPADSFRIKRALRLLHCDTRPQPFVLLSVLTGPLPSSFLFWSRTRFA